MAGWLQCNGLQCGLILAVVWRVHYMAEQAISSACPAAGHRGRHTSQAWLLPTVRRSLGFGRCSRSLSRGRLLAGGQLMRGSGSTRGRRHGSHR